jgi:fused signal recognition particle receptor
VASWSLGKALRSLWQQETIDESTWEELEDALLVADAGVDYAESLVAEVREEAERIGLNTPKDVKSLLVETIETRLATHDPTLNLTERPAVVLLVGVNGVGKTTTIGKFARYLINAGRSVVVAAADTFRAAAVDQVALWADRAGAEIVRPDSDGQDPASVAYQAVQRAIDEGIDMVLVDTAGRLHTKTGLMDELTKVKRVIEKLAPVSEVLLVLDATTGQNGLAQAEAFLEQAGVTGLVVTKLDGSAKGGFVLGVQDKTGLPVKLIGEGESVDDLRGFSAKRFAEALMD